MEGAGSSYLEKSELLKTNAFTKIMDSQQNLKFSPNGKAFNHSATYCRFCEHSIYSRVDTLLI